MAKTTQTRLERAEKRLKKIENAANHCWNPLPVLPILEAARAEVNEARSEAVAFQKAPRLVKAVR